MKMNTAERILAKGGIATYREKGMPHKQAIKEYPDGRKYLIELVNNQIIILKDLTPNNKNEKLR